MDHLNRPVSSPTRGINALSGSSVQHDGIIFASAARAAATYTSEPMFNADAKGVRLFTVSNNDPGAGTVTVKIQVQDPNTKAWIDLAGATTAALTDSTGALLTVYPGITGIADSAGVTNNQHLGPVWRVVATVADAEVTFSVGAAYLL